jgi:hypothetical protein
MMPPIFTFSLPNGDKLRVVRKDIMDAALKRSNATRKPVDGS